MLNFSAGEFVTSRIQESETAFQLDDIEIGELINLLNIHAKGMIKFFMVQLLMV